MKKRIGTFLAVFIVLSISCGIAASALFVNPMYSYTVSAYSVLSFYDDGTASCTSSLTGMSCATGVSGTQYLEKKNGSKWEVVPYCNWFKMDIGQLLDIHNTKSGLDEGTYRVRAVFTVYSGMSNETVEAISNEVIL